MTNSQHLVDPEHLLERVRVAARALAAVGAGAAGAGILLMLCGATYYQSLLEEIHAHWATESVGYAAMVFAGAHTLQVLLMTTAMTYAMAVGGVLSWHSIWYGIAVSGLMLALYFALALAWPAVKIGKAAFSVS